jgi:hypothetical protein
MNWILDSVKLVANGGMPAYASNGHAPFFRFIELAHANDEKVLVKQSSHKNLAVRACWTWLTDVPGADLYAYRGAMSSGTQSFSWRFGSTREK